MAKNNEGNKCGKIDQCSSPGPSTGVTVTMEVPMKDLQGELVMTTIRLPCRLVAGAAGRPILLTITPKAGGGRQAVLLPPKPRKAKGEDRDSGQGGSQAALPREHLETPKGKESEDGSNNEVVYNDANYRADYEDEDSKWVRKYFEKTPSN